LPPLGRHHRHHRRRRGRALIGRSIAGRGDSTLGTIIGGAIGAVIGNSVERGGNRQRCN
jgi:uncharacterized membrane protein